MAPSAVSLEVKSTDSSLPDSKDATNGQPHYAGRCADDITPLQAVSHGPIIIGGVPKFSNYHEHRRHILIHIAAVFRDFSRKGFTEGMSGHISVRDPEFEDYIWMNPLGKHFGLMTAGDLICLDANTGAIVGGNKVWQWLEFDSDATQSRPANAAGFLIHSEVHKARPDVHAVCHAHTIAGRAWSAFGKPLEMINQDVCNFHNALATYATYGGVVLAAEEGKNIAKAMGMNSKGAILMNHGLLTVGGTVDEAGFLFGLLDRACQIQLQVEAACAGNPALKKQFICDDDAAYNFKMASDPDTLYAEIQPDLDFIFETDGFEVVSRGVEHMRID